MIPEQPGTSLDDAFQEVKELADIKKGSDLKAQVLQQAVILEGSVRNTGTHACGVIITPDDLTKFVPCRRRETPTCWSPNSTTVWWKVPAC